MSRLLSSIGSMTRRLFTPGTPPSAFTSPLHQAWMHEQMKEYSVKRLYAGPLDADLNPTGETWEMRLAYRSAMKEPAIKAPLLKKVYAVASLSPQVLPENPESPADKEAASWFDYAITNARGGWPRLLHDCCLHPLLEGFAIGEKVRERVVRGKWKDRWGLHAVKFKETRDLRFELDEFRNITAIRSFAGAMGGRRFDPDDFLKITHIPIFENPFGQSDLRAAYRSINLISASIKLRAILLENFSGPFLVYKYGNTARIEEARNALANARSRGYISIDKTDDLQVVNLATSAPDQFQTTIDDLRKEAATAIAGAYLQMLESSSPQGNSETHKSVSELFEWWLASTVAATINEQLIPDLHDEHYPNSVGRPHVMLGGIDPNSAEKAAANLTAAKQLGLPTSKRRAYEQLDVEPPKDDEDFLGGKPPEPQPQQPQPGQPPQDPQQQPAAGGNEDGGDDPFAKYRPASNPHSNFSGTIKDSLGRSRHYVDGRPVAKQFADDAPVPPELLAAILVAHADGDDAAVQALLELADDPQGLQDLIDDDGPKVKQFDGGWTAAKTKTGGTKAVNGGRTLYGQAAQRALANQGKTDRGETLPEHPIAMAKRLKAEREPSREEARKQWATAVAGRDVKAKDLPALAGHLHALTRDEIKEHLRGLEQKVGGLKADLVQRMLDHVEGIDFSLDADRPTGTESAGERQKRRQEQEATGHSFRENWQEQKRQEAENNKSTDERVHDNARRMATVPDGAPGTPKPRATDHTDPENRHYTDKNYDDEAVQRGAELAHAANELKPFSGKKTDYVDRVAKGARDRLEANANDAPDVKGGSGTRNGKVDVPKPKETPKTFHEQFFAADKAGRDRLTAEAAAGEHGPEVQAEIAPGAKVTPPTHAPFDAGEFQTVHKADWNGRLGDKIDGAVNPKIGEAYVLRQSQHKEPLVRVPYPGGHKRDIPQGAFDQLAKKLSVAGHDPKAALPAALAAGHGTDKKAAERVDEWLAVNSGGTTPAPAAPVPAKTAAPKPTAEELESHTAWEGEHRASGLKFRVDGTGAVHVSGKTDRHESALAKAGFRAKDNPDDDIDAGVRRLRGRSADEYEGTVDQAINLNVPESHRLGDALGVNVGSKVSGKRFVKGNRHTPYSPPQPATDRGAMLTETGKAAPAQSPPAPPSSAPPHPHDAKIAALQAKIDARGDIMGTVRSDPSQDLRDWAEIDRLKAERDGTPAKESSPNPTTVVDKPTTVGNTTGVGSQSASPKPEGGKMELPTLQGASEKQIQFGHDKRTSFLDPEQHYNKVHARAMLGAVGDQAHKFTDAKDWIEKEGVSFSKLMAHKYDLSQGAASQANQVITDKINAVEAKKAMLSKRGKPYVHNDVIDGDDTENLVAAVGAEKAAKIASAFGFKLTMPEGGAA